MHEYRLFCRREVYVLLIHAAAPVPVLVEKVLEVKDSHHVVCLAKDKLQHKVIGIEVENAVVHRHVIAP